MQECKICLRPFCEWSGIIKENVLYIKRRDGSLVMLTEDEEYYEFLILEASEHRVLILVNGKWGFADIHTGQVTVDPVWDYAGEFFNGYATVSIGCNPLICDDMINNQPSQGGKFGCINLLGQVTVPIIYDEIRSSNGLMYDGLTSFDRYVVVNNNGLEGVVDLSNREIVPLQYSTVIPVGDKSFLCSQVDNKGYSFLHKSDIIFSDAEAIYRAKHISHNRKESVYFIARNHKKFAVFCGDGRMITDFNLLLRDAKDIVHKLSGRLKFGPWLSVDVNSTAPNIKVY